MDKNILYQELFERMEAEINAEINLKDRFRLVQLEETGEICYFVSELSKSLDFFIYNGDEKMYFIQNGDFFKLDELDIEQPFWGIETQDSTDDTSKKQELVVYYYSPCL